MSMNGWAPYRECVACGARGSVEVKLTTSTGTLVIAYEACKECEGNGEIRNPLPEPDEPSPRHSIPPAGWSL